MDPVNQNDQENQNLSQQYQDILDRYAKDLDQKNNSETTSESVEENPNDNSSQPIGNILQDQSQPIEDIPKDPLELTENISQSPEISDSSPTNEIVPPPTSNLFKYIFYLSLVIFIGVAITILYNLYFKKSLSDNDISNNITPTSTINTVPTITPSDTTSVCNLNDQSYKVGDSFKAADGCNSCTCTEDLTISCTEIACETPPSIKLTPTKSATISANQYKNEKYNYSLTFPSSWLNKYYIVEKNKSTVFNYYKDISNPPKEFLFAINVYTEKEWIEEQSGPHGELIKKDTVNDRVFVLSFSLSNTFTGQEADDFNEMVGDVNQIISTFKLTK